MNRAFCLATYYFCSHLSFLQWAAASWPTHFSEAQIALLESGRTIVGVNTEHDLLQGEVWAAILIPSPPPPIWEIMTDCPKAPEFVPGLKACEILSKGDDYEIIKHRVKYSFLLPSITYTFKADYDFLKSVRFEQLEGHLESFSGDWELKTFPENQGTLIIYSVTMDVGFWIPDFLVKQSLMKDLPKVLEALRQRVAEKTSATPQGADPTVHGLEE